MANNKRLNATIVIGGSIAGSLKTAFSSTTSGLKKIGQEIRETEKRQVTLGKAIQSFGKVTGSTRLQVDGLRRSYAESIATIDRLRAAQNRLSTAQSRYNALTKASHKIGGASLAVGAAGAVMAAPSMVAIKEAKSYQTESARVRALGLGDATTKEAIDYSSGLKTYGTSKLENLTLTRDALSVFGDLHHAQMAVPTLAKMKFGNAAFYGGEHGADNESKFMDMLKVIELRGGTKSQADFEKQANMVQRVISATGGRVGPSEWRNMISTGGLAAKGTRDDAFYYQMEPLVQEMGGDKVGTGMSAAYSSLYQGRTTKRAAMNLEKLGLIGDHSKVKNDKVGQVSHIDPGALKGSELFRQSQYEWMKQVLLPTLAKKGLTSKDQVLDAIGSIFSNKKGGDLFGAMYLQMQQIDKNEKLNRGAADIDTINGAGKGMAAGKEIDAEAKLADLKLRMGTDILPLYTRGLEMATGALESLNGFIDRNPRLSKAMFVGVAGLSAGLLTLAPVLLSVGGALSAYAGYTIVLAKFPAIAKGVSLLTAPLRLAGTAFRFLGTGIMWAGRALLMNPIGLAITAIAAGAFLIYENWDKLKPWFTGLWDDITATFKTALTWITSKIEGIGQAWGKTKAFFGFGDSPSAAANPPALPAIPASGGRGAGGTDNRKYEINVTQQPGQSPGATAAAVASRLGAPAAASSPLFDLGM